MSNVIVWPDGHQLGVVGSAAVGTAAEGYPLLIVGEVDGDSAPGTDFGEISGLPTTLGGYGIIDAQPLDATLTALAAANWSLNAMPIGTGADTLAQTTFAANTFPARASTGNLVAKAITDFGLSLVDDADATAARTTLGLGSAATVSIGTSGAAIPLLNAANTWSLAQTFTVAPVFTDASGTRTALGLATVASTGSASDITTGNLPYAQLPGAGGLWSYGAAGTVQFSGGIEIQGGSGGANRIVTSATNGMIFQGSATASTNAYQWRNGSGTAVISVPVGTTRVQFPGQVEMATDAGIAKAANATSATTGFFWLPVVGGTPTGVPASTNFSGSVACEFDSSNRRLYFYTGSAWRYVAVQETNSVRLSADATAIAAGTTPSAVASLQQAVRVGEAWDIEWLIDYTLSVGTDILIVNMAATAGTATGTFHVLGVGGSAPDDFSGSPKMATLNVGTASTAAAQNPGNLGSTTKKGTLIIRARFAQTTADGTIQLLLRAVSSAGASSGTLTVKANSVMYATRTA